MTSTHWFALTLPEALVSVEHFRVSDGHQVLVLIFQRAHQTEWSCWSAISRVTQQHIRSRAFQIARSTWASFICKCICGSQKWLLVNCCRLLLCSLCAELRWRWSDRLHVMKLSVTEARGSLLPFEPLRPRQGSLCFSLQPTPITPFSFAPSSLSSNLKV